MRTLLIGHETDALDRDGLARWLASWSDLSGVLVIREPPKRMWRRIRREIRRVGALRFLDVLGWRLFYRLFLASRDAAWEADAVQALRARFPEAPEATRELIVASPNAAEARAFIRDGAPDIVIARCKTLLKEEVFAIPRHGTFVIHPGICPMYRNAHGGFWALANDDLEHVGATLLRIDKGVDTGPVFGYYRYAFDERRESPMVIQRRVVLENLDALRDKLEDIVRGAAQPIDTHGMPSATWGQPWLSRYIRWRIRARRRAKQKA